MNKTNFTILFLSVSLLCFLCFNSYGLNLYLSLSLAIALGIIVAYFGSKQSQKTRASDVLLLSLFLGVIFLPILSKKETASFEKRPLAPEPVFNPEYIWGYFFDFQKYYEDRFAFRNTLVEYYSKTKLHVFNSSPLPFVGIGEDQWLFYTKTLLIEESQKPFTEKELKQIRLNLRLITTWLKEKNMDYYFLLLPYKQRIYPEYQSAIIAHQFSYSKVDQLYNYLLKDSIIQCIDVRKQLVEGKKTMPTYLKTDTHWTEFGAYLAYREVMKELAKNYPQLKPYPMQSFSIDSSRTGEGDLQLMMGLKDDILFDYYKFTLKNAPEILLIDSSKISNPNSRYSIRERKEKNTGLKIFVVRDSFTEYLRKYLTPHFDRSFYAWMPVMPADKVLEEKPNIVLQEMLEQFINQTLELPLAIQQDTVFLKANLKRLVD